MIAAAATHPLPWWIILILIGVLAVTIPLAGWAIGRLADRIEGADQEATDA